MYGGDDVNDQSRKPMAFVLMPFKPEMRWVYDDIIVPALTGEGYHVERADDPIHQRALLKDIIVGVYEADLIIADLTELNPNVMYELGIAHTAGIPTLMMTQNISDAPFDLRSYRLNEYAKRSSDIEKIKSTLSKIGRGRIEGKIAFGNPVADFQPEVQQALFTASAAIAIHPEIVAVSLTDSVSLSIEEKFGVSVDTAANFQRLFEMGGSYLDIWSDATQAASDRYGSEFNTALATYGQLGHHKGSSARRKQAVLDAASALEKWAGAFDDALENLVTAAVFLEDSTDELIALSPEVLSGVRDTETGAVDASERFTTGLPASIEDFKRAKSQLSAASTFSPQTKRAMRKLAQRIDDTTDALELLLAYGRRVESFLHNRADDEHDG